MTTFIVKAENGKEFEYDNRPDADDHAKKIRNQFDIGAEVTVQGDSETDGGEVVAQQSHDEISEDGQTVETVEQPTTDPEPVPQAHDLPDEPNLTDDPFAWMPGDFVDTIDGTPTINRRGYAALGRKFGISAPSKTVHVGPEETDHTYCRVEAVVVDDEDREYVNHGSAHVDRGDDPTLLLELATTRARKRALAGATGVGLIAVEELKNEL